MIVGVIVGSELELELELADGDDAGAPVIKGCPNALGCLSR